MNPEQLKPNLPDMTKNEEYNIRYANGFFYPNGLQINWGAEKIGFGGLNFWFDTEMGKMVCHSEQMGKRFVTAVMAKMIQETIFSDFESHTKESRSVTLAEADTLMNFKSNVLYTAFYSGHDETDKSLYEMRWRVANDKVLNIWFDTKVVGERIQDFDNLLDFECHLSQEKSFKTGFVKAELWSWTREEKN